MTTVGPIGRLGAWAADHFRAVLVAWIVVAVGLGVLAPRVETALSGAGWESSGSQSVQARALIDQHFGGQSSAALMVVVHSPVATVGDPQFAAVVDRVAGTLRADSRVASVAMPRAGVSISQDGHTAIVSAGANGSTTEMVAAADALKGDLKAAGADGVQVSLTGASGMWSDFNVANRNAMMKSELLSWPVTLVILLLAFGSLVAAGLPLMLTILGLVASAGTLYIGSRFFDISIWAMNFALMFALALGIDYALFVVHRFRGAFFGSKLTAREAVAVTMDTAGKAVLFSGATVLISLSAVMLVPSPAFRSMALGIMVAVIFVLLATMTLLPAVLAKLGPRVDKLSLKWVHTGEHRSPLFAAWAERLWKRPLLYGTAALAILVALDSAGPGAEDGNAVDQGRAEERHLAPGLHARPVRLRAGRTRRPPDRRSGPRDGARRSDREGRSWNCESDADAVGIGWHAAATGGAERRPVEHRGRCDDRSPARASCRRALSSAARPPRTTISSRRSRRRRRS